MQSGSSYGGGWIEKIEEIKPCWTLFSSENEKWPTNGKHGSSWNQRVLVLLKGVQTPFLWDCLAGPNQAGLQARSQAAELGTTWSFNVWSLRFLVPLAEESTPLSPESLRLRRSCHQTSSPSLLSSGFLLGPSSVGKSLFSFSWTAIEGLSVPMRNKM